MTPHTTIYLAFSRIYDTLHNRNTPASLLRFSQERQEYCDLCTAQVFDLTPVQLTADCYQFATRAYGNLVQFTAHLKPTRIAQIWAGT